MTQVMELSKLEDTSLWKRLAGTPGAFPQALAGNLVAVCAEASERMKAMPAYAPEYTLHDETHLLRTTELMARILGDQVSELNVVELALLILAAFFHDQGMVPSKEEYSKKESNPEFSLYRDNWVVDHPNYGEIAKQLGALSTSEDEKQRLAARVAELDASMLTNFLRATHARRSAKFVREQYGEDKRLEIYRVNLASLLAKLCESHALPVENLTPQNGFRFDEDIGTNKVNMPYLTVILRLADILDFDRDRTPEPLLRSIHFTNEVSLQEWEKHRSVEGWTISPSRVRFTMKSKHPVYEKSARQYMDEIEAELAACQEFVRSQPQEFARYRLNLPTHVDRSRIEPSDNAYHYRDLEFQLSRDEIVRLLMTDKLYGQPHLCIRELLQNALDALRYRKAMYASAGASWDDGRVELRHHLDENGYEVVQCCDNGSGMDEQIVENHFVKVGRSFYRSPEFERERVGLRATGNDFDPSSQFGIGFMSCFMLGDQITIKTRRDHGPGRNWGPPLIIEISGLGGLFVIRDGEPDQSIGTSVSIRSRTKPLLLDSWTDKVQLITVLKGYALATEFPITGRCDVPELSESVEIPPLPERIPTFLERFNVRNVVTLEQDLSEVDSSLRGTARESLLLHESDCPCVANDEARWVGITKGQSKEWHLRLSSDDRASYCDFLPSSRWESVPVCVDGILVAGPPGRASYREEAWRHLGSHNSHFYFKGSALLDVRGDLKPELTPGRVPPEYYGEFSRSPGWRRLEHKFKQGLGLLTGQLADYLNKGLTPEDFWRLVGVHELSVPWMRAEKVWHLVSVSLIDSEGSSSWRKICDLADIYMGQGLNSGLQLLDEQGRKIGAGLALDTWEKQGSERPTLGWQMNVTVLLLSSLDVRDKKVVLRPTPPSDSRLHPSTYSASLSIGVRTVLIDYVGAASLAVAVETPYPTANRKHPLVTESHKARYTREPNELEQFADGFTHCISQTLSSTGNTTSFEKPGYWQKRVGHLFFAVPWDRYEPALGPPYKVWTSQKGWFDFGEDDLARWRDSSAKIE